MIMADIYLYHLDREIHALFGLDDPRQYKYAKVYSESELILKLAILLCDGTIILPASNFFESNLGFNLLNSMDFSEHIDDVLFSLCSSSYNLSEFLEKKKIEHADAINKNGHHYREFINNTNLFNIPGRMIKRKGSASEDIKKAWISEDKLIELAKKIHSYFPQAYKAGELEQLISEIPTLLGGRAFISGYITPFFRPSISNSKLLDNTINCFITREYIRSFLDEYKAAYISDIDLFQAELVLPTGNEYQHYSYKEYKRKLLESFYNGMTAWEYLVKCNKFDLIKFKNTDCWKQIFYNHNKVFTINATNETTVKELSDNNTFENPKTTMINNYQSINFCFVVITPGWGYTNGGINVFNKEMCIGIANTIKSEKVKLICIAPNIPQDEYKCAKDKGIELISVDPESFNAENIIKALKKIDEIKNTRLAFVGHDIYTGQISNQCKEAFSGSISAVIHHMSYNSYYPLVNTDANATSEKESKQIDVLCKADIVFANGPVLKDSASDIVGDKVRVVEILPGVSAVETRSTPPHNFKVVTCGRVEPSDGTKVNNSIIKQVYLSVAAWASFVDTYIKSPEVDSMMKVYGKQKDGNEIIDDLNSLINNNCTALHAFSIVEYENDRNELLRNLSSFSLSMMLSLREGFGLTALEAISAGVPVIISERSGLYSAINRERLNGYIQHVQIDGKKDFPYFTEDDKARVVDRIYYIYQHQDEEKRKTLELKKQLEEKGFSWIQCGKTVVNEIIQLF